MADFGYILLLMAFALAPFATVAAPWGQRKKRPDLTQLAYHAVYAIFGALTIAMLVLLYALIQPNFVMQYVVEHVNRALPILYRLSALWGGQEGSLLLWAWLLALYAVIVLRAQRGTITEMQLSYVIMVLVGSNAFIIFLLIFYSNPFARLEMIPPDGMGLNPLLQNIGMIFHPPTLYLGYVGFTVPFAFAVAALMTNTLNDWWLRATRHWSLFSWLTLGVGIILGMQWAYVELGWGGYWGWDPVENASLMPWLIGTAYLHSAIVQQRRGAFKHWNMWFAAGTFLLCVFGTFITRSGFIESVHAFQRSPLGYFFLGFMGVIIGCFAVLMWYRRTHLQSEHTTEAVASKESAFFFTNLMFVAATFVVFFGTVFPTIAQSLGIYMSLDTSFFNRVAAPVLLGVIMLIGLCTPLLWREVRRDVLLARYQYAVLFAAIIMLVTALLGVSEIWAAVAFSVLAFVIATIVQDFWRLTNARRRGATESYPTAFLMVIHKARRHYGGYFVHLGVVMIALGIVGSSFFKLETQGTLMAGETMDVGNYALRYENIDVIELPNKDRVEATVSVLERGTTRLLGYLRPRKDFHHNSEQPQTEVAVRTTIREDLYIVLAGWDNNGEIVTFQVTVNPLVVWIWIGGFVLLGGGVLSLWTPLARRVVVTDQPISMKNKSRPINRRAARTLK